MAVRKYRSALRKCKKEKAEPALREALHGNLAVCLVKLARWEEAVRRAPTTVSIWSRRVSRLWTFERLERTRTRSWLFQNSVDVVAKSWPVVEGAGGRSGERGDRAL